MELIQYNTALAITGAIRSTSREKLYQELGLESLRKRRWYRKLCSFFQISKDLRLIFSKYFLALAKVIIPELKVTFPTSVLNIFFLEFFFPSTVIEWNNLDLKIRNFETF